MPLCVENPFPRLDASEASITTAAEPRRSKLIPRRRLCCKATPYDIR